MSSLPLRHPWIWCLAFLPAISPAGEATPPALVALPTPLALSAEVRAAGTKAGMPLGPLVLDLEPGAARAGDGVVALITLSNGATQKQWLVQFEIDDFNEKEKNIEGQFIETLTLASGRKLEFTSKPTFALKIRALGPFVTLPYNPKTAGQSAVDKTGRALLSSDFLAIGLDRASRLMLDQGTPSLAAAGPTLEKLSDADIRTVVGAFVALTQFFTIAQQTPGLKEIVWEIIDLPSIWSLARSLGKINLNFDSGTSSLAAVDPAGWSLGTLPLYRYPGAISLNGKPAVQCAFFVTAPHPPLLTTAGIVGFTAESPSHKDKRMLVQLIAAYRGKTPPESSPAAPAPH